MIPATPAVGLWNHWTVVRSGNHLCVQVNPEAPEKKTILAVLSQQPMRIFPPSPGHMVSQDAPKKGTNYANKKQLGACQIQLP